MFSLLVWLGINGPDMQFLLQYQFYLIALILKLDLIIYLGLLSLLLKSWSSYKVSLTEDTVMWIC